MKRPPYEKARLASTTHGYNYVDSYVEALGAVIDMEVIRSAHLAIGVDPLGGAGVNYWEGNRNFKGPFGLDRKVPKKSPGGSIRGLRSLE